MKFPKTVYVSLNEEDDGELYAYRTEEELLDLDDGTPMAVYELKQTGNVVSRNVIELNKK